MPGCTSLVEIVRFVSDDTLRRRKSRLNERERDSVIGLQLEPVAEVGDQLTTQNDLGNDLGAPPVLILLRKRERNSPIHSLDLTRFHLEYPF